ncbi:MAG: hypothetical protein ACREOW_01405 [Thermodesulfobacteriota bacterium]
MLVFTEEWIQQLQNRYERRERFRRPLIYSVATNVAFQSMRAEVETWVADLPQALQRELIQRLRSSKNFRHTYHELAVGSLLKKAGFRAEYGKNLSGQTPDWYVQAKGNIPPFIVEVFTSNVSEAQMLEETQINELRGGLHQMPFDVGLRISFNSQAVELDQRRNKVIAHEIKLWLTRDNPAVGDEICLNDLTIEVVCCGQGFLSVQLMGFSRGFWVNPEPLRKNLVTKVNKYKKLISATRIPLIIGVVADFFTGLGSDDLENVLFGQKVFDVFNKFTGEVVSQTVSRKNDGLFVERPLLSAAIWGWKSYSDEWKMKAFINTVAQNPFSPNVFDDSR